MMKRFAIFCLALGISACSSTKQLPDLEKIDSSIEIAAQWVAPAGEIHRRQHAQLPVTVVSGVVYVANAGGYVAALNLHSGKLLWQINFNERIIAGPGYGNGVVVIGNNEAEVIALQEKTGKELWRKHLSSEVLATPLVDENRVFVQTIDGRIYALNLQNGEKIWVEGREIPALTLRGTSSPVRVKDRLLVGFASGQLVAFNPTSGKTEWEVSVAVPRGRTDLERIVDIDGIFYANEDVVYVVSYQGRMAAVSLIDGNITWSRDMSSYTGVSVDDEQIYVTDETSRVWALDKSTGATLWRQDKLIDREIGAPIILAGTVVVADRGGVVHWLSKEDGDFVARQDLYKLYLSTHVDWNEEFLDERDYGVTTNLAEAENYLLVRNNEGSLAAFFIVNN